MAGLLPLTQQESELRIADFLLDVPPYGAAHGATRCTDRSVARDAAGRASSLNAGRREAENVFRFFEKRFLRRCINE